MSKPSEIQLAFTKLHEAMEGMAKDAKGWKVSDIAAVNGMRSAIINLKQELLLSQTEITNLKASLPKIKADAVCDYIETSWAHRVDVEYVELWKLIRDAKKYANKVKAGE